MRKRSLGILGDDVQQSGPVPVRIVPDPTPPPGPYPVRPGYQRPQDSYPVYRWNPPVPFRDANFSMGAYYQDPVTTPISGLGQACAPCQIMAGSQCVPCPDGFDAPECVNCAGGLPVESSSWWDRSHVLAPVLVSAIAIAAGSLLAAALMKN
jgi:hypothetical protein